MSRFVVPTRPGLAGGEPPDDFKGRLAKYVPTGILALYTSAVGGVISSKPDPTVAPWIALGLILLFCAGTIVSFWRKAPVAVRKAHVIASPIAFLAWSYPLAAPLLGNWFVGWAAIVGQAVAALCAWLLVPEEGAAQQGAG